MFFNIILKSEKRLYVNDEHVAINSSYHFSQNN